MATVTRPFRSILYMPGSNARALEKAKTLDADGLIFDLEDAVSPDKKEQARELVTSAAIAAGNSEYGNRYICIRANALDTPWGEDDLKALAQANPDAILLAKVNGAKDIEKALSILIPAGLSEDTAIWVMMETPLAILHAEEIAAAPRVKALIMGTADLVTDLHAKHTVDRLSVITSLNLCVLAARAYGLTVLDGVYLDLDDQQGFEAVCQQGLELGFDGKTLIHPKQLESANTIFAPSTAEIEYSKRVIAAHIKAEQQGKGVVLVDGKLVENLHFAEAQRIVAMADIIANQ